MVTRSHRLRAGRSLAAVAAARDEIMDWLALRTADPAFVRFTHHFEVLGSVLGRALGELESAFEAAARLPSSGETYRRCGELDRGLITVRRVFEWYATKYDQRLDRRLGPALRAADEVVRSCWQQPFRVLRRQAPTGPLPYLDLRFDAHATPRVSVPADLQGPADGPVARFVQELPIPVIALPSWATQEAWWLALAAHETGHHVQYDLEPGLIQATRDALTAAVGGDIAYAWAGWAREVFADAYSALMLGPAAAWPVEELEHGPEAVMAALPRPGSAYPPPMVRHGLLAELARMGGPSAPEAPAGLKPHMDCVPAAVQALLDLPIGRSTLRAVSGWRAGWFGEGGLVAQWERRIKVPEPTLTKLGEPAAARLLIAAGVAAAEGAPRVVHENLIELLPRCGPPGRMGEPPTQPETTDIAARLARDLVREGGR